MKKRIPEWRGWMKSKADDDGSGPPRSVEEIRREIRAECHRRKRLYDAWIHAGVLADDPVASYNFGPFDLPLDVFTSSRWHERRTQLPLPIDREGWQICWEFWHRSNSYRGIKESVEQHGMYRPIIAEWFVNYDPKAGKLVHPCYAFHGENLPWPFLILRTGNERLMMAMFDWGWKTIPTQILVRDCGYSAAVSVMLRWLADEAIAGGMILSKDAMRKVSDIDGFDGREGRS